MGLQEVKKKIVEEAERQAKLLLADADTEAKKIERAAKEEVEKYKSELQQNAETMLKTAERKEHAAAEFEGKRILLDTKKALIEQVMGETTQRLQKLPSAERNKLLEKLMKKAAHEIDIKKVYVNEKDGAAAKSKGIAVEKKAMLGGLIAETEDGKISVDFSFETLLEQLKHEHLREIGEVLFT